MNPFKYTSLYHYYLVNNNIKATETVLDFGTGDATFICNVSKKVKKTYAFDVDKNNIKKAKKKCKNVNFKYVPIGKKLPYKNNFFDAVFMFHVLEHVQSESEAIKEAHRVLKKKGILYLASPYRGMFTWADTANLRYRFPLIHKKFMELSLGKKEYDNRFIKQQKQGLYGDCTSTRTWHKHYKEHEISTLLNGKFDIEEFYKFSLFHPFLLVMQNVFDYFFKRKSDLVKKMIWYDNKLNAGELSYNMLAICTKK